VSWPSSAGLPYDPWRFTAGVVSLCASAVGWVQMRCRECAAEVAVTARVCSGCGAPIVGQPPVVADTVAADIVVGANSDTAVSDAAGKAVAAGVAEQALPEPDVPGSGARVPAELRLVLAGYVGVACAWFAVALAGALAFAGLIFFGDDFDRYTEMVLGDGALHWLLYNVAILAFVLGLLWGPIGGVCDGRSNAADPSQVFEAASAAQRSTHGHGDGLGAWWTHVDTRHSAGRYRPRVPVAVRGASRVVDEGRHAGAR